MAMAGARVAAIQMCSRMSVTENLATTARLLEEARRGGAKLAVLPETFPIFHTDPQEKVRVREKFGEGPIQHFLAEQARANSMWIVAGTIPIESSDPKKIRAASLVYNAEGECVARYDKTHLFDAKISETQIYRESDTVEAGAADESNIKVVDTPLGKIGLCVCYDLRFPEFIRLLMEKGAEIIVAPSAFTAPTGKAHWELLARGLVAQNLCYFVGSCQGGLHENGRETHGHSMIVGPWAEILAKADKEGVISADIDVAQVYIARGRIPVHEHRRFETAVKKPAPPLTFGAGLAVKVRTEHSDDGTSPRY